MNAISSITAGQFITFLILLNSGFSVVLLLLAVPAFKRTKHVGFVLWIVAACFGVGSFLLVVTARVMHQRGLYDAFIFAYMLSIIIAFVGTLLIIRSYTKLFDSASPKDRLLPSISSK